MLWSIGSFQPFPSSWECFLSSLFETSVLLSWCSDTGSSELETDLTDPEFYFLDSGMTQGNIEKIESTKNVLPFPSAVISNIKEIVGCLQWLTLHLERTLVFDQYFFDLFRPTEGICFKCGDCKNGKCKIILIHEQSKLAFCSWFFPPYIKLLNLYEIFCTFVDIPTFSLISSKRDV